MSYKQWQVTDPKILVTNPKVLKIKIIKVLIINILLKKVIVIFNLGVSVVWTQRWLPHPELASSPPQDPVPLMGLRTCAVTSPVSSARKGAFGKTTFTKERARRIHLGGRCAQESGILSDP